MKKKSVKILKIHKAENLTLGWKKANVSETEILEGKSLSHNYEGGITKYLWNNYTSQAKV